MDSFCLFGPKTISLFDVWSFEHFLTGISMACLAHWLLRSWLSAVPAAIKPKIVMMATLNMAFGWEMLEHYMETGLMGAAVAFWLQGVENWSNRMLTDNIMVLSGCLLFLKRPSYALFARIGSFIWLFAHIFLMPHSMYLQNLLMPNGIGCFKPL